MYAIKEKIKPVAYMMLIRTVKSDDLWLSEVFNDQGEKNYIIIHFTLIPNVTAVAEVLLEIEKALMPFQARPHWGKFFKMPSAQFLPSFPKLKDFR